MQNVKAGGKVFALSGVEASKSNNLIWGTCFINGISLITIIDTSVTHSFISVDCLKRLNLIMSPMGRGMIVDTLANGSVTNYSVDLNCPLTIFGRDFGIGLVCLLLSQLDVILEMNWLEFNCIYINCYSKAMLFLEFMEEKDPTFISASQMREFLKDEAKCLLLYK